MVFLFFILILPACSQKVVEKLVTQIEYRDRTVYDTATVEIPVEVEKVVTRDTASHLENTYAKSDAVVSGGFLSHSLESKPQIIRVPVEVKVTDTLWREQEVKEVPVEVKVEKPLPWWKRAELRLFWWLVLAVVGLAGWTFRKPLGKLFGIL